MLKINSVGTIFAKGKWSLWHTGNYDYKSHCYWEVAFLCGRSPLFKREGVLLPFLGCHHRGSPRFFGCSAKKRSSKTSLGKDVAGKPQTKTWTWMQHLQVSSEESAVSLTQERPPREGVYRSILPMCLEKAEAHSYTFSSRSISHWYITVTINVPQYYL